MGSKTGGKYVVNVGVFLKNTVCGLDGLEVEGSGRTLWKMIPPTPTPTHTLYPPVLGVPDGLRPSSFQDLQDEQEEATTFQMVPQPKLFPCWVLEVEITTLLLGHMVTACRGLRTPPLLLPPARPSAVIWVHAVICKENQSRSFCRNHTK